MLSSLNSNSGINYDNFKPFSNKVDLSSNKMYLKNAYGTDVYYYNDPVKKEKNKRNYILILASTAIVVIGALIAAIRTKKIDIDFIAKETEKLPINKFSDAVRNMAMNFTNVKDDLWKRFSVFLSDNTPIKSVKAAGDKLTDVYRATFKKGITKRLSNIESNIQKYIGNSQELKDVIQLKEFDFDKINSEMTDALSKNSISKGLFSLDDGVQGVLKRVASPLANNVIAETVKNHANIIDIEQLKKLNASEELIKEVKKYNAIQLEELFPKLRDINCGSAPTDVLTAAVPILGFTMAVKNTDDKEKRDSLIFNIGLPLLPTFLMPFVGLKFPILNGFRGLMTGLAVGQATKQTVRLADRKIFNKNKNNSNAVT